eukprot:130915_1
MCTMDITYQYDHDIKKKKHFRTNQGKQMLLNPNLMLQNIDQSILDKTGKGVTIYISMEIKYQLKFDDGNKSECRIWRYKKEKFKVVEVERNFNWKINNSTTFTSNLLNVSSLWISNKSVINCVPMDVNNSGIFKIICKKKKKK